MPRRTRARMRFETLARAPEGRARLAEAALWIAAEAYPDLDVPAWLGQLDALGRAAADRIAPDMGVDAAAATLARFLFVEEGFRGNRAEYYDPRNSFLNDVLSRRLGIPITLAVIYIEVAAAAGVCARGVGLPGHFLVRIEHGGDHRLLDPFHGGEALSEADCHGLMQQIYGAEVSFDASYLRPVTTREILGRMLANLKGIYLRQRDWPRALTAVEWITLLRPDVPSEIRDRGLLHARLGQVESAIRDWELYLRAAPGASDAERVRENLRTLRQTLAVLN